MISFFLYVYLARL